jgi:hypothetical protein
MTTAFVLGNGISRQGISLLALQERGSVYGCNALYREFVPDVLIATDRPIATAIQESGYSSQHRFYTRRPLPNLGAHAVPKPYFGFSSGPIAVGLAALDGHACIYLLGFDMGPTTANTINNLYAGTEFYRDNNAPPTYTGNWIKQLTQVMTEHKSVRFFRVQGPTTAQIPQFDTIHNLNHVDLATFTDRINNKKDL